MAARTAQIITVGIYSTIILLSCPTTDYREAFEHLKFSDILRNCLRMHFMPEFYQSVIFFISGFLAGRKSMNIINATSANATMEPITFPFPVNKLPS